MNRGLHVESTYSSFLLLAQNLGLTQVSIRPIGPTPLSINLTSPIADTLTRISPLIMIFVLLVISLLFFLRIKQDKVKVPAGGQPDMSPIINYSFLAVLGFVLAGNIFSPQFMIWFLVLAPLVTGRWRHFPWILFAIACMLTYYLYPTHYNSFTGGDRGMVYILLFRNLALIASACFLAIPGKADTIGEFFSKLCFKRWCAPMALVFIAVAVFGLQLLFNMNADAGGMGQDGMPGGRGPGGRPPSNEAPPNFPGGGSGGGQGFSQPPVN
ncbi:MAG: hypothetical protein A2Z02_06360 [Chloroflexi bacterium RBG_16_48_7]|nr:MAG: hypothetical protein A2Z02_06360 [Chloroflexi bacterium RBG_16_48_7]